MHGGGSPARALAVAALAAVFVVDGAAAQRAPSERRDVRLVWTVTPGDSAAGTSFFTISDVKVSRDGHVVVLDSVGCRIRVIAPDGSHLADFGERGPLPGQLIAPTELTVTDSTVTVRDGAHRRWMTFALDGRHVSTRPEPASPAVGGRPAARGAATAAEKATPMRGGVTVVERLPPVVRMIIETLPAGSLERQVGIRRSDRGDVEWLFRIRTPTVYLHRINGVESRMLSTAIRSAVMIMPVAPALSRFGAGGAWARSGDSLMAHADGYSGDVTWYAIDARGATVVERASLGRVGRGVTPEDVADETARLSAIANVVRGRDPSFRDSVVMLSPPVRWSIATTALFAEDGSLWVGINRIYHVAAGVTTGVRVGEENTWAVFSSDGSAFTVTLRPMFRLTAVSQGRLYGYVDEGEAPPTVVVYALQR